MDRPSRTAATLTPTSTGMCFFKSALMSEGMASPSARPTVVGAGVGVAHSRLKFVSGAAAAARATVITLTRAKTTAHGRRRRHGAEQDQGGERSC